MKTYTIVQIVESLVDAKSEDEALQAILEGGSLYEVARYNTEIAKVEEYNDLSEDAA